MILPDANLLLYAYDAASPFHSKARKWWEECLSGTETVVLCPLVLAAFVRLATHPRVFEHPLSVEVASGHVLGWLERRVVRTVAVEVQDLRAAFALLCRAGTGGDLTTDAQLAALALRLGATIHSADTDFLRFSGLKVHNPVRD